MIVALFIIVSLLTLGGFVWKIVKGRKTLTREGFHLNSRQREIDIGVLSLLLSRKENDYLRRRLSAEQFRRLRRDRLSLARRYLHAIDSSTGEFIRAAEVVKSSTNAELAQAAEELLPTAFRVRLNVRIVQFCLFVEWLFPSLSLAAPPRLDRYRELGATIVVLLDRLQADSPTKIPAG